jgi:hypothetical protein
MNDNTTGAAIYVMPAAGIKIGSPNPNRRPCDKDTLEGIIDIHGLPEVVRMLAEICSEKAEHILVNWDDKALADRWNKASAQIGQALSLLPRRGRKLRTSA